MTNHIALFEPLMPANTGNIARTCAGTNTELHLIEPLGFSTDDKYLKRAGLDYWDSVKITYHKNLVDFIESIPDLDYLYLVSKFATHAYTEVDYSDTSKDHYFLLGKETTGLPEPFMRQ
ncbi:MAG TPA: tRNA (uridine(34)/cytosine(34)/5-carboxymethylaminomethyluridine(34)-2'-O)-methyltransferase TrmL, partial [Candidatus Ligilactobacillus excrementipullorum]|nr:tRNA (uridine(34)/cytosine(34)/5-carboxymethylaminomethyluridine(34)-2'-O)-methyltransferase TrmL [Candidatus Ligilactobacillus excrementipullorum]